MDSESDVGVAAISIVRFSMFVRFRPRLLGRGSAVGTCFSSMVGGDACMSPTWAETGPDEMLAALSATRSRVACAVPLLGSPTCAVMESVLCEGFSVSCNNSGDGDGGASALRVIFGEGLGDNGTTMAVMGAGTDKRVTPF